MGVKFTMNRVVIFILAVGVLSGCATKAPPDLTGYTLEDFQNEPAVCNFTSQCKYIGYGIGNGGCSSAPIFDRFIIYSTKMGKSNIEHLNNLADQSRRYGSRIYAQGTMFAAVEGIDFEVCLPVGNIKPNLKCIKSTCKDIGYNEE